MYPTPYPSGDRAAEESSSAADEPTPAVDEPAEAEPSAASPLDTLASTEGSPTVADFADRHAEEPQTEAALVEVTEPTEQIDAEADPGGAVTESEDLSATEDRVADYLDPDAAVAEPEPAEAAAEPEPETAEAEPEAAEAEPETAEAEPEPAQAEAEPEPETAETEPQTAETEPEPEPEPAEAEAEPETAEAEPEPAHAEAEPEPEPAEAEEPAAAEAEEPAAAEEPATEPVPVGAAEAAPAAVALRPGEVAESRIIIWAEADAQGFRERITAVQAGFVDDPGAAVHSASAVVSDAVAALATALQQQGDDLDPHGSSDNPDTESLRIAMRGYRQFLERILAL